MKIDTFLNFIDEVVDLVEGGDYFNYRIGDTGRAYDLFDNYSLTFFQFVICRGGADIDCLTGFGFKFRKCQGTVVKSCR